MRHWWNMVLHASWPSSWVPLRLWAGQCYSTCMFLRQCETLSLVQPVLRSAGSWMLDSTSWWWTAQRSDSLSRNTNNEKEAVLLSVHAVTGMYAEVCECLLVRPAVANGQWWPYCRLQHRSAAAQKPPPAALDHGCCRGGDLVCPQQCWRSHCIQKELRVQRHISHL